MAKKASSAAPEWGEMLTPGSLQRYGALDVPFPDGACERKSSWKGAWQIWLLRRSTRDQNLRGCIEVEREPVDGNGILALSARQSLAQPSHRVTHRTKASLKCAADLLCSPVEWSLGASFISPGGETVFPEASLDMRGKIADSCLEVAHGRRISRRELQGPVSSSWSLLEALSSLPGTMTDPIDFTLLDELDKVKQGQRLTFRETTTIDFAGGKRDVHCYQQIGYGTLPWLYYVDSKAGLLLAINGLRAYIRDANVPQNYAKMMAGNSSREKAGRGRKGGAR